MSKIDIPLIKNENGDTLVFSIEGCNGAGKTTLLNNFKQQHSDIECLLCVPEIYQTAKDTKSFMLFKATALCSALYYFGGAVEVRKTHNKNFTKVLFDRSLWSTFAAAYAKDESIIPELVACLNIIRGHVYIPDMIIVLEASYETCQARSSKKVEGGEFDKDKKEAHEKKADFYHKLSEAGYNVKFIDVNKISPQEVLIKFENIISDYTKQRNSSRCPSEIILD